MSARHDRAGGGNAYRLRQETGFAVPGVDGAHLFLACHARVSA